jgi:hypothetical protein
MVEDHEQVVGEDRCVVIGYGTDWTVKDKSGCD